jgi:hypothetical protein
MPHRGRRRSTGRSLMIKVFFTAAALMLLAVTGCTYGRGGSYRDYNYDRDQGHYRTYPERPYPYGSYPSNPSYGR